MKATIIFPILGAFLLVGIATSTLINGRIDATQEAHRIDVVRIEETQKKHIEQIAVVETKIDTVQKTLDRIEGKLDD